MKKKSDKKLTVHGSKPIPANMLSLVIRTVLIESGKVTCVNSAKVPSQALQFSLMEDVSFDLICELSKTGYVLLSDVVR